MLELTSALERSLNFSQTGNAKVLVKGLMIPLGLALGIIKDGMPMLNRDIIEFNPTSGSGIGVAINAETWPLDSKRLPSIASKRSHLLNYSDIHFEVSQVSIILTFSFSFSFSNCALLAHL
jgi:hypothetical protein